MEEDRIMKVSAQNDHHGGGETASRLCALE